MMEFDSDRFEVEVHSRNFYSGEFNTQPLIHHEHNQSEYRGPVGIRGPGATMIPGREIKIIPRNEAAYHELRSRLPELITTERLITPSLTPIVHQTVKPEFVEQLAEFNKKEAERCKLASIFIKLAQRFGAYIDETESAPVKRPPPEGWFTTTVTYDYRVPFVIYAQLASPLAQFFN